MKTLQDVIADVQKQKEIYQQRQKQHEATFAQAQQMQQQAQNAVAACSGALEECDRLLKEYQPDNMVSINEYDIPALMKAVSNGKEQSVQGASGAVVGDASANSGIDKQETGTVPAADTPPN